MTSLYNVAIPPVLRGLKNCAAFLQKGENHAKSNSIDPADYISGRLHPDMADLPYQIYRLTDSAKFMPFRINPSIEALSLPDVEKTFPELQARLQRTIDYLEAIKPEDLDGKEANTVELKMRAPDGNIVEVKFPAVEYVQIYAHPNFWFHVTTAYGILRMKGVDVGKMDFLNGAQLVKT